MNNHIEPSTQNFHHIKLQNTEQPELKQFCVTQNQALALNIAVFYPEITAVL